MNRTLLAAALVAFSVVTTSAQSIGAAMLHGTENVYFVLNNEGSQFAKFDLKGMKWSEVYDAKTFAPGMPFAKLSSFMYHPTEDNFWALNAEGTQFAKFDLKTMKWSKTFATKEFAPNNPFATISCFIFHPKEKQYFVFNREGTQFAKFDLNKMAWSPVFAMKDFAPANPFGDNARAMMYHPTEDNYWLFDKGGKNFAKFDLKGMKWSKVFKAEDFAPKFPLK